MPGSDEDDDAYLYGDDAGTTDVGTAQVAGETGPLHRKLQHRL